MELDDPWYSLHDLPAGKVRCRVRWSGYAVEAACEIDRKGRRIWYEIKGRDSIEPLRAPIEAWQPADLLRWTWPNGVAPDPLPVQVAPRMASIGGVAFDATASSEELEADRQAAMARRGEKKPKEGPQWWRDVSRIEYEPMGSVSRGHGEARIMRALILEKSIRLDLAPYRTNAAVLAAFKMALPDNVGPCPRCDGSGRDVRGTQCPKCRGYGVTQAAPESDWVPRLAMQPQDTADFDTVMGWLAEVMPSRRELFVLRCRMLSPPEEWDAIGAHIRRTEEKAKALYDRTLDDLIEAANRPAYRAMARLRELQARNREMRR